MFSRLSKSAKLGAQKFQKAQQKVAKPAQFQVRPSSNRSDFQEGVIFTGQFGIDLLHDPLMNKGTAFSQTERDRLLLRGLLPPSVKSTDIQLKRLRHQFNRSEDPIEKYLFCIQLQDRNETLFYRFILDNIKDVAPIIYTPTVGRACQEFGAIYRRPRGMYFSAEDRGEMSSMVWNYPVKDIDIIVVTDGGRILGLGDLGANGMGIPIGKLALYVAAGGINPGRVLPVMLDVGTNNEALLNNELYLGIQQRRLTGDAYYEIVDEFMRAVTQRWPNVLIQFEDFTPDKANPVLEKYRNEFACFNDDIQGTGATVVAGILNCLRMKGSHYSDICNQKFVIAGAGSAGIGVADSLVLAMMNEGLSEQEALKRFYMVDYHGLITHSRENVTPQQYRFAKARDDTPEGLSLVETIKRVKPDILLGISGVGGLFTDEVIKEMGKHSRPIIFPLSNPTSKSECTAEKAFTLTNGKCIFASGSPFNDVVMNGVTYHTSQSNNMFIYPGVGLGVVAGGLRNISNSMFYAASKALAATVSNEDIAIGRAYPMVDDIRTVTPNIAAAVIQQALEEGQFVKMKKNSLNNVHDLASAIKERMWEPKYSTIVFNPNYT